MLVLHQKKIINKENSSKMRSLHSQKLKLVVCMIMAIYIEYSVYYIAILQFVIKKFLPTFLGFCAFAIYVHYTKTTSYLSHQQLCFIFS